MRLAYNLGEVWSEDLLHQGHGGLHVICRLALAVRIALITMPGKAFRCDKQWHFERLKQMSLVQLKWKWPCTTIKWGIPTRFVKMTFLGFKMFIFRDVVGCNAQKRLILFFQKSCDRRPQKTSAGSGEGMGFYARALGRRRWGRGGRRLHMATQLFILFPSKTDGWLTSKYTQMVPKGKPSTQTSHFWGSIAVSWLGGLVGRLKNERGNCVGP